MERSDQIAVSEYFYSLQGEGITMGIPAFFIRLTGCNLMCGGKGVEKDGLMRDGATWICDTIKVWMKGQTYGIAELVKFLDQEFGLLEKLSNGVHLIITGGEPLLQAQRTINLISFINKQINAPAIVEIETNGTFLPSNELDQLVSYWNCSPKLSNSGMPSQQCLIPKQLQWFSENPKTMFKFVISQPSDFEEINELFKYYNLDRKKLVLMPAANNIENLLINNKMVAELCIEHNVRMCTRLHVEIWNQLTGV